LKTKTRRKIRIDADIPDGAFEKFKKDYVDSQIKLCMWTGNKLNVCQSSIFAAFKKYIKESIYDMLDLKVRPGEPEYEKLRLRNMKNQNHK
jgi:hypothetical protein